MRTSDLPATTAVAATDVFESENARGTPQKNTLTQILTFISSGALRSVSPSAGIGYATGAGLAVTQITNRSTEVIIAAICGAITTDATSLAAGDEATFTVTNTAVAVGDVVVVSLRSGATANTSIPVVSAVAAGSFNIRLTNLSADTADTGASIINFAVIKAVGA
jgi:hypothetical protein